MEPEELLQANRGFLSRFHPQKIAHHPARKLALLTCIDCRLTAFVEQALGIERGDAVVIRNAGNTLVDRDVLRSLAIATLLQGVDTILVLGHTDCAMASTQASQVLNAMAEVGVKRDCIGSLTLHEWFGFFSDVEGNIRHTVESIARSPVIPKSVQVLGMVIDTETGALRRIV